MGTVHQLRSTSIDAPAFPLAVARFLDAPSPSTRLPLAEGTRSTYQRFLVLLHSNARTGDHRSAPFSADDPVSVLDGPQGAERLLTWFRTRYAEASGNTWNSTRATLRSACDYWVRQGWLTSDPTDGLERRGVRSGPPRAKPRQDVEVLLDRRDLHVREKALVSLLYDSAARVHEVLAIDVEDVDLDNRRAPVNRKGGAADVIMWEPRTSRLLRRLIGDRTRGPVFLTDRKAKRNLHLDPADVCPDTGRARLSYRRAEEILDEITGGWNPHDLRHSSLTHDSEDGMPVPLLMTKSGHRSIRSLARYTRPSIEAVDRWKAENSPARRAQRRR